MAERGSRGESLTRGEQARSEDRLSLIDVVLNA